MRIERLDGSTTQVTRLTSSTPAFVVDAAPHRMEVARTYLALGIEHILTGVDHLLFVSGLLLLVNGFKRLIQTVSAFTLSHSVTLTLATLGFVHVPPAPVEAVIALSIVFVAYEVLRSPAESSRIGATETLVGRVHVRPAAWTWLRWWTQCGGLAGRTRSGRFSFLQCRG